MMMMMIIMMMIDKASFDFYCGKISFVICLSLDVLYMYVTLF